MLAHLSYSTHFFQFVASCAYHIRSRYRHHQYSVESCLWWPKYEWHSYYIDHFFLDFQYIYNFEATSIYSIYYYIMCNHVKINEVLIVLNKKPIYLLWKVLTWERSIPRSQTFQFKSTTSTNFLIHSNKSNIKLMHYNFTTILMFNKKYWSSS